MRQGDLDLGRIHYLMRYAVLSQRPGNTRVDEPEVSFARGRTDPVAAENLAAAKESARRAQDQFLKDLERRTAAFLAEIQSQRAAWESLTESGDCLHSELLTVTQDQDPGPAIGGGLYGDDEERTFRG